jgi:predicted nucleic acid-binding Zn finger protein
MGMKKLQKGKLERATELANTRCVKIHKFIPSGRSICTVVGKESEELVDPLKQLCTCGDFFYRVLTGKTDVCYHLLAYKIAEENELFEIIEFDDSEYFSFMKALLEDLAGT